MYLVLKRMATALPLLLHRFPLFKCIPTHGGTTLTFLPDKVTKRIANFSQFAAEHHTSFDELHAAYSAAGAAGRAAAASRMPPSLVTACEGPELIASRDVFKVKLQPVGYSAAPASEQVSGQHRQLPLVPMLHG